ncbi:hypothetical protein V2A60_000299 [Cordyceps javanica]
MTLLAQDSGDDKKRRIPHQGRDPAGFTQGADHHHTPGQYRLEVETTSRVLE